MAGNGVTFEPRWDAGMAGYAQRWVATNHWRVRAVCADREDAVQECLVVYAKCARLYAGRIDNQAWFMAVYKTALANYWIQLARHSQRLVKGDAAARQAAQAAPQAEAATAPLIVALGEARRQPASQLVHGALSAQLGWLLSELPPDTLPQCGRVSQRALVRALWREAA